MKDKIVFSDPPASGFALVIPETDSLNFFAQGVEVIRIAQDGAVFWHGIKVESDADFKLAMLDLAASLKALCARYSSC